jgi:hypothetical protein
MNPTLRAALWFVVLCLLIGVGLWFTPWFPIN